MIDSKTIQLTTLWFVVMTFIQTAESGGNPLLSVLAIFAILLTYVLPVVIVGRLAAGVLRD
ncbi:hypothetical protein [Halobacterium jilantaiense]|uniref:Uncharacterized protein n=1 Tax=Halobacterium jilantaiense TaxID=355548 RepID=A0A1I0P0B3_9EURY|nr:hypothetical protein [Halobacterium jilantaiense]SEW07694.1 hypothetical protein SAMN04487945_1302 [Halobacterium jilantaiense]